MTAQSSTITVYDGTVEPEVLDEAAMMYREIYAEAPYFEEVTDFANFSKDLPRRAEQKSFRLVIARFGLEPVGFALGHRLPPSTRWWEGAVSALPQDITLENDGRTFAVIELAVRSPRRRRGLGRRIHAHLTADLSEKRITLLVRPDAEPAQAAYAAWGYRRVGQIQPALSAPRYDAMILATTRLPTETVFDRM